MIQVPTYYTIDKWLDEKDLELAAGSSFSVDLLGQRIHRVAITRYNGEYSLYVRYGFRRSAIYKLREVHDGQEEEA